MDFASLYVKEAKLNEDNKFTLDFADEDEIKKVVFSPDKDYYITTLNANIKLEEDKKALIQNLKLSDAWDNILKLSNLSNELNTKGADFQNDIKSVLFKINDSGFIPQTETLNIILTNEIIDAMSYKYRYYDVQEYKFKEGKIYDPYKHLRDDRISFMVTRNNTRKIYTAKLDFKKDKIIQSLYFDRKTFDFDTFYQAKNQFFIYDGYNKKYIGSRAYYHRAINYFFQSVGRQIPAADISIRDYYNTLQPHEKTIICSEKTWERLRQSEKDKIRFIVSPTTTGLVFVAKQSICRATLNSILKYGQYVQTVTLNDRQINVIRRQFPDFAINEFEQ